MTTTNLCALIRALTDSQVAYDRAAGTVTVGAAEVEALVRWRAEVEKTC